MMWSQYTSGTSHLGSLSSSYLLYGHSSSCVLQLHISPPYHCCIFTFPSEVNLTSWIFSLVLKFEISSDSFFCYLTIWALYAALCVYLCIWDGVFSFFPPEENAVWWWSYSVRSFSAKTSCNRVATSHLWSQSTSFLIHPRNFWLLSFTFILIITFLNIPLCWAIPNSKPQTPVSQFRYRLKRETSESTKTWGETTHFDGSYSQTGREKDPKMLPYEING